MCSLAAAAAAGCPGGRLSVSPGAPAPRDQTPGASPRRGPWAGTPPRMWDVPGRDREAGPPAGAQLGPRRPVACLRSGRLGLRLLLSLGFLLSSIPPHPLSSSPWSFLHSRLTISQCPRLSFGPCGLEGTGQVEHSIIRWFSSQPASPPLPAPSPGFPPLNLALGTRLGPRPPCSCSGNLH